MRADRQGQGLARQPFGNRELSLFVAVFLFIIGKEGHRTRIMDGKADPLRLQFIHYFFAIDAAIFGQDRVEAVMGRGALMVWWRQEGQFLHIIERIGQGGGIFGACRLECVQPVDLGQSDGGPRSHSCGN